MLLEAKPVLYQAKDGRVFYLGESITKIERDVPGHFAPSCILVDLDGGTSLKETAYSIQNLAKGQIILASPPGPTIDSNWKDQMSYYLIFVLRNWESDEFWAARSAALLLSLRKC
jgi:hypothetical protein